MGKVGQQHMAVLDSHTLLSASKSREKRPGTILRLPMIGTLCYKGMKVLIDMEGFEWWVLLKWVRLGQDNSGTTTLLAARH